MNILFLTELYPHPNRGGVERVTCLLAEEFMRRGHKVMACHTAPDDSTGKRCKFEAVHADCSRSQSKFDFPMFLNSNEIDVIIVQNYNPDIKLLLEQAKGRAKVVSVYHNQPFPLLGKVAKAKKITCPDTIKGKALRLIGMASPWIYASARRKVWRSQFREILELSDRLYLLSKHFIPRMRKFAPELDFNRIEAINNPNTFTSTGKHKVERENLLLWIGRFTDPQKNGKDFIKLWSLFHGRHPEWRAIMAGDGERMQDYKEYARKLNVSDLDFCGNRSDVDVLYSQAKFLIVTSLYEGWGMIINEARAYGCVPVVANTYEATADLILDGRNGILVDRLSPKTMAEAVEKAIPDFARLSKDCPESIEKFSIGRITDIWEYKLNRLTEKNDLERKTDS